MDYIVLGNNAYSVSGGIQVEAGEVYSDSDFAFMDIAPSNLAQLRDAADARTLFQTTLFGRGVDASGTFMPNDDNGRVEASIAVFKCFQVDAQEMAATDIKNIMDQAAYNSILLEKLRIYRKAVDNSDITQTRALELLAKASLVWTQFKDCVVNSSHLTTGGQTALTVVATGLPLAANCSYEYQPRWQFGTLKMRLLQLWQS